MSKNDYRDLDSYPIKFAAVVIDKLNLQSTASKAMVAIEIVLSSFFLIVILLFLLYDFVTVFFPPRARRSPEALIIGSIIFAISLLAVYTRERVEKTEQRKQTADKKQASDLVPTIRRTMDGGGHNQGSNAWEKIAAVAFGIIFVCVLLAIAIFIPRPTQFQIFVFRVVLALAAGGLGAVIPGLIHVQAGPFVRAGGAIALFVVVFWFNPPQLLASNDSSGESRLTRNNVSETGWTIGPRNQPTMINGISSREECPVTGRPCLVILFGGPYVEKSQIFKAKPALGPGHVVKGHIWCQEPTKLRSIALFVEDHTYIWKGDWRHISVMAPSWKPLSYQIPQDAATPFERVGFEFGSLDAWSGECYLDDFGW